LRHFSDLDDATKYAGITEMTRQPLLLLPIMQFQASCVTFQTWMTQPTTQASRK
jgi:hypothetical protein